MHIFHTRTCYHYIAYTSFVYRQPLELVATMYRIVLPVMQNPPCFLVTFGTSSTGYNTLMSACIQMHACIYMYSTIVCASSTNFKYVGKYSNGCLQLCDGMQYIDSPVYLGGIQDYQNVTGWIHWHWPSLIYRNRDESKEISKHSFALYERSCKWRVDLHTGLPRVILATLK